MAAFSRVIGCDSGRVHPLAIDVDDIDDYVAKKIVVVGHLTGIQDCWGEVVSDWGPRQLGWSCL